MLKSATILTNRVFHPWFKWECYRAGFYSTRPPNGVTAEQAKKEYALFLRNLDRFGFAIDKLFRKWPNSCEHFLTNKSINRIAWVGQASMCIETGIPSKFKSGFQGLSNVERELANQKAKEKIEQWEQKQK